MTYDEIYTEVNNIESKKDGNVNLNDWTGAGKESYLTWVQEWKTSYKKLSRMIRMMKAARKTYKYEYRAKGDTLSKKRRVVGPNPNLDAEFAAFNKARVARMKGAFLAPMILEDTARKMMDLREKAKKRAMAEKQALNAA